MKRKGYLYVATGDKYLKEAYISVQSLLKVDPAADITLVTDASQQETDAFKNVVYLNEDQDKPYLYKIRAIGLSPYEQTIYLDSDTYFCDKCTELFELLDHFDWLIGQCNSDYFSVFDQSGREIKGLYAYNTGVIVFKKNDKTTQLLNEWYQAYSRHFDKYIHDQAPFMEALLTVNLKTYIFQTIYNARTPYPFHIIAKPVKIIHGRHNDFAAIAKKLNRNTKHTRIWFPRGKLVLSYGRTIFFKWYMSLNPTIKMRIKNLIKPIIMKLGMRDYI
jgi:hypothetical protein